MKQNESIAKATWIQARAAIVLSVLTFFMLIFSMIQINKQNEQYQVINRPVISSTFVNNGYVHQGAIDFVNTGNLGARDLMATWSLVRLEGDKIIQEYPSEIFRPAGGGLAPEETFSVSFRSLFKPTDDPVFLVLVWAYNGPGINGYRYMTDQFYWNVKADPMAWIRPNPFGADQRRGVTQVKNMLISILKSQIKPNAVYLCESCNES